MVEVHKYVNLYEIHNGSETQQRIIGGGEKGDFSRILHLVFSEYISGLDEEYKEEVLRDFPGVTEAFFYSDAVTPDNIIRDRNLIATLKQLLKAGAFDEYGLLRVYLDW